MCETQPKKESTEGGTVSIYGGTAGGKVTAGN
jgi:hypothetical protein